MDFSTILDPPILFFCLGVIAVWCKSNIEIPSNTTKFLSYYLLMSIGFKGGMELAKNSISGHMVLVILAGVGMALFIPMWMYFLLRTKVDRMNSAAIAACYGSVSAVTFVAGITWLENNGLKYGGHMVALMALMEAPAIILGLILAGSQKNSSGQVQSKLNFKHIFHDAFFNGSVFILLGSLLIGFMTDPQKLPGFSVFIYDMFKGFLSFFLLDLGITAAKQIKELKGQVWFLALVGLISPLINAVLGLALAYLIGMNPAEGFLFIVLCASASYIAVPAALKVALPEAQPGIYLSMALGLTFPFNLLFGLSIYWSWAQRVLG